MALHENRACPSCGVCVELGDNPAICLGCAASVWFVHAECLSHLGAEWPRDDGLERDRTTPKLGLGHQHETAISRCPRCHTKLPLEASRFDGHLFRLAMEDEC